MIAISIVIPAYLRIEQTLRTIHLLKQSIGIDTAFSLEVIVSDSSPNDKLQKALQDTYNNTVVHTRPARPGIAANKNKGASIASSSVIVFCDSDIEVKSNTLVQTVQSLQQHPTAGAIGGSVYWKGGSVDGTLDRPRSEDRQLSINGTNYVEALYSRYFATYKEVFKTLGGYDETVFNMRGEGSDLSIRYWRQGYPLVYDPEIEVQHVYESEGGIIRGTSHPEWGIARDYLLLMLKYQMTHGEYENLKLTMSANFKHEGEQAFYRIFQGIGQNIEHVCKSLNEFPTEEKLKKDPYNFKFLEVFSEKKLYTVCIEQAEHLLASVREPLFSQK